MTRAHHRPPNPPANGETLHPSVLAREMAKVCADLGLRLPPARIRLLVQHYLRTGHGMPVEAWVLTYADPTGEHAASNVDRERSR